jgi:hypothetical protein
VNILFNRPSTPEPAAIRERIFNVLPAATYQMAKLFGLFDIESSAFNRTQPPFQNVTMLITNG